MATAPAPRPNPARAAQPADLGGLQRWFHDAILGPDDCPDSGDGHPHRRPDGCPDDLAAVLTGSSRQSARERLAVYRRGYRLRLLGCLRSCHPALRHLLGPEAFDVLAMDYVDACPPRGYTLDRFVRGFATHLAGTRPAEPDPWVGLVVDLARFERAFAEVYDAAEPDPYRLLVCTHRVHAYATAVARGEDPEPPAPEPVVLAMRRRGYRVVVTETPDPESRRRTIAADRHGPPARTPAPV